MRDDAVLPEVRRIGIGVMLVLITASSLLYLLPGNTERHWAWTIMPSMSALFMGCGYGAGVYFFQRVSFGGSWHAVAAYFPGIALFTTLLGIATVIHWERFNHDHVSFWAWAFLYFTTPVLVPLLYLRNRRADTGLPDRADAEVPPALRALVGIGGLVFLAIAAVMFLAPSTAIDAWPWTLNEATSRSLAAYFAAPGVAAALLSRDRRWSSWKVFVRSSAIAAGLIALAGVRAWEDFDSSNPLAYVFVAGTAAVCVGSVVFDRLMASRLR